MIEELGRAVAPGPFVPTVIASAVIADDGTAEQKARLLPGLIDGTVTAGVGLAGQVASMTAWPTVTPASCWAPGWPSCC